MAEAIESNEMLEAKCLNMNAEAAKRGYRGIVVVGKVKDIRSYTGQNGVTYVTAEVVAGEGTTINLSLEQDARRPGKFDCCAFLVEPRMNQGKIAGFKCLSFA